MNIPNLRHHLVEVCGGMGEVCVKIASIGFSIWFQNAYSLGIGFYLKNQSRNLRILEPKEDSFCLKWDFQDQNVFQFLGQLNHSEHHVCKLCQMGKVFRSNILENQWVRECVFGLSSSVFCGFRHMWMHSGKTAVNRSKTQNKKSQLFCFYSNPKIQISLMKLY